VTDWGKLKMSGVGLFCCMGVGFVVAQVKDKEAMDLQ